MKNCSRYQRNCVDCIEIILSRKYFPGRKTSAAWKFITPLDEDACACARRQRARSRKLSKSTFDYSERREATSCVCTAAEARAQLTASSRGRRLQSPHLPADKLRRRICTRLRVTGNIEVYCRTVIDFYRFFFVNNSVLSTLSTEESVVMRGCNLCDNVRNKMWHHSVVILVCLCLCRQKLDSIKRVARIFLVHPRGSWRCLVRCSEIFTARRYA